jgi:hypothetical protein
VSRTFALPLSAAGYGGVHAAVAGALAVRAGTLVVPASPSPLTWVGVAALVTVGCWIPASAVADPLARTVGGSVVAAAAVSIPGAAFAVAALVGEVAPALPRSLLGVATLASLTAAAVVCSTARARRAATLTADRDPVTTVAARRPRRRELAATAVGVAGVAVAGVAVRVVLGDGSSFGVLGAAVAGVVHLAFRGLGGDADRYTYAVYDDGLRVGTAGDGPRTFLAWSRFDGVTRDDDVLRLRRPVPWPDYRLAVDDLHDPDAAEREFRRRVRR